MTTNPYRNPDGTFKEGNPFSTGKPKGARHKTTILAEEMMVDKGLKVFNMTMDRALAGDIEAQNLITREFIKIYIPPKKSREIEIDLPQIADGRDVWQGLLEITNAALRGEITVEEAQGRIDLLSTISNNLGLSFIRN